MHQYCINGNHQARAEGEPERGKRQAVNHPVLGAVALAAAAPKTSESWIVQYYTLHRSGQILRQWSGTYHGDMFHSPPESFVT